jgi:hypothetical protein
MVSAMQPKTSADSFPWRVDPIELPRPRVDFGVSLAKALSARRSTREFDTARKVPQLVLSELLWCACGINPRATGDRTVHPGVTHAK